MLLLLAAAASTQVIQSNSPPPQAAVISLERPASTGITLAPRVVAIGQVSPFEEQPPVAIYRVRTRVTSGNRVLFDDVLRVSRNGPANYTVNRHEAALVTCPAPRSTGGQERQSLNIQLYLREEPQIGPLISLNVSWQRPTEGSGCFGEGTRSVSLVDTVPLQPGKSTTLSGDAGLAVTLSSE